MKINDVIWKSLCVGVVQKLRNKILGILSFDRQIYFC
jgi:hypothetical protein